MKLSILICTYKRPDLVADVLGDIETAFANAPDDWELIVVDNAGDAGTKDTCNRSFLANSNLKYIDEPKVGLSAARNRAVLESSGQWLLFLDDDVRFGEAFIIQMLEAIDLHNLDVICPRLFTPIQSDWPRWLRTRIKSGVGQFDLGDVEQMLDGSTKIPVGACMCIRRKTFDKFGPFHENIGRSGKKLFGGEETLLFKEAFQNSARGVYLPTILVRHEFVSIKNTKRYWRSQGFYGGRSTVRMLEHRSRNQLSRLKLLLLAATSMFKSAARSIAMLLIPSESFENQYRAIAHFGIAYEALLTIFGSRTSAQDK